MPTHTVLIFDDRFESYDAERQILSEVDAEVIVLGQPVVESDPQTIARADAVLVNLLPMDASNIAALGSRCRVISRYGVGMDNVDISAATRAGIWCANVAGYASEDVSDHALALLMSCVRMVPQRDRELREGQWNSANRVVAHRTLGKTLGLIGFGGIGRALCHKVSGFGFRSVLVYDPYVDEAVIAAAGARPVSLQSLFAESDYVSVHAPLSDETRGMVGHEQFAAMKPTAILVNTARGPLVNEQALAHALSSGQIAAAGIDVFASEPLEEDSPLRKLDNVVLTDHVGWYTEESIVELKSGCAANAREVLKGNPPVHPVNVISPPQPTR